MERELHVRMQHGVPRNFRWQHRSIAVVAILDCWREVGEWWKSSPELWVWRIQGDNRGIYELAWNRTSNQWWMARIYD